MNLFRAFFPGLNWNICLAAFVSLPVMAAPGVFDVRQFGAKGDGKTVDTAAIQRAFDEAGKAGGIVRFSPGVYLSKPIAFRGKTTLKLDAGATLKATDEPSDFADPGRPGSFIAFISAKDLSDLTISGPGVIDGSGARWWVPAEAARRKTPGYTLPRPRMIVFTRCNTIRVQDVTLQNSPCFHLVPNECLDVVITNVTIKAPAGSPNTDAIDPSGSKDVLITRCLLDVGDDNVAIKAGHAVPGRSAASENITVIDCTFLHGHGMSIGSETVGGVKNVTVERCSFQDTENGIRIKSPRGRGGTVENILYSDITMKDVDPAITITCYYPKIPAEDSAQVITDTTPAFRNIRIRNLSATSTRSAGIIIGLPERPISGVILENVHISAATTGLTIRNAKGVRLKNVEVTNGEGPPIILQDTQAESADLPNGAQEK